MKSKNSLKPIIGVTTGDPAGIGSEIILKALETPAINKLAQFIIIGERKSYISSVRKLPDNVELLDLGLLKKKQVKLGRPTSQTAKASLAYLDHAIEMLKDNKIRALVTGPLCKEAVSSLGKHFKGHTEYLAEAFGVKQYDMMFYSKKIKTIVVTRHIPLSRVSQSLRKEKIYQTITLGDNTLKHFLKIAKPNIAVCGLNPHAGEGGSIGTEEITKIIPAITMAQKKGIHVQGPFAADTIFSPKIAQSFDLIIAMYHDQGTIPVKTLAFNKIVNFTIGLPFIRTSPAHGTAFNIAGKNIANASSMKEALKLAALLAVRQPKPERHSN